MSNKVDEIMHQKEKVEVPEIFYNNKINLKLVLELLAAFSIVFSILWAIKVEQHKNEWDKKIETLHVLQARDRSPIRLINAQLQGINNNDSVLNTILSDTTLLLNVKNQLTTFEDIGIGYNIGIYDKEVIIKFMGTSFIKFYKKITPYINYVRKKNNNSKLYIEYEECAKSIILSENNVAYEK